MSLELRAVFDTNTAVSALLFEQSVPGKAFFAALDCGKILLSQATFAELHEVLAREKFDRYLTREEREEFLTMLLREATVVEMTEEIRACRDPKDDKFLELAVSGRATCLVTGDQDLLALHPFRGIPILTPTQFLAWLRQESDGGPHQEVRPP
ncbi:MAG TPA: putative toxin-antitoxin system toxin component, PIN family [Gemmataceae bacterium]|nr:putative toxin-antitoxin system toxin component, PIN family [Gemmataceae bacterium]